MKNKKFFRNLASIRSGYIMSVVVLGIIVLMLNVFQFLFLDDFYLNDTKKDMIYTAEQIESIDFNSTNFLKDISEIEAQNNIYVEMYAPKDELVYTSNSNSWVYDSNQSESNNKKQELKPRIMKILTHADIDNESYFETRQEYYATAKYIVYSHTNGDRVLEIYYSSDLLAENTHTASRMIFSLSLIFFIVFVAFVMIYLSIFIAPLVRINNITKKLVKMDFDETCPGFKIKEIDELSENINALSASLKLTLRDLKSKNMKLEQDIEKEHQFEKIREQFIANASHELKTPISIIQGYAEGLKFGITNGASEEYCDTIIEETQKMNSLVLRMLELTRFEHSSYKANINQFNILEFLNDSLSSMKLKFEEKGIRLNVEVDPLYKGFGDKNILFHVFDNYLSNAISHCEGEMEITVSCSELDASYRVSVFNTGKPIDKEDIDHIWESFYRADKAHSRSQGRFGLGLSIVTVVQDIHKQKYGVNNCVDGVEFWFDIAKNQIA